MGEGRRAGAAAEAGCRWGLSEEWKCSWTGAGGMARISNKLAMTQRKWHEGFCPLEALVLAAAGLRAMDAG